LIAQFLAAIGSDVNLIDCARSTGINPTINSAGVHLLRQLNCLYKITNDPKLMRIKKNLPKNLLKHEVFTRQHGRLLTSQQSRDLLKRFEPQNRRIVDKFNCARDLLNVDDLKADHVVSASIKLEQMNLFVEEARNSYDAIGAT
jgi:hypothetical protein